MAAPAAPFRRGGHPRIDLRLEVLPTPLARSRSLHLDFGWGRCLANWNRPPELIICRCDSFQSFLSKKNPISLFSEGMLGIAQFRSKNLSFYALALSIAREWHCTVWQKWKKFKVKTHLESDGWGVSVNGRVVGWNELLRTDFSILQVIIQFRVLSWDVADVLGGIRYDHCN